MLKIAGADARQALDKLWLQTVGLHGLPLQPEALVPGSNVGSLVPDHALTAMATWLDDRSTTIAGGSAEVQRSIVAKAVLGL
ncbi:MAG: acyl-CoA dehydrogenase family protein [Minwuia sp.]|nr:acyl-CoA dehydrogenase family protein [Minwuia sp.]